LEKGWSTFQQKRAAGLGVDDIEGVELSPPGEIGTFGVSKREKESLGGEKLCFTVEGVCCGERLAPKYRIVGGARGLKGQVEKM